MADDHDGTAHDGTAHDGTAHDGTAHDGDAAGGHERPRPGTGEDARRLLSAAQEWAQEWAQRAMPAPPSGHPGPECQWCPLCQFASVLRGEHPEVTERVAEAGAALVSALRLFVDAAVARTGAAMGQGAPAQGGGPTKPQPTPRVQRITLDGPDDED